MSEHKHSLVAAIFVAGLLGGGCETTAAGGEVITPEEVRGVFIRRSVCQGVALNVGLIRVLANVDGSAAAASAELDCGRGATSCEEFLACSSVDSSVPCDPATTPFECDGSVLQSCDLSGFLRRVECEGLEGNMTCLTDEASIARCSIEACVGTGELLCVDGFIESCSAGVRSRADDCNVSERTCVTNAERAACVDRAEACERDVCEGDILLRCVSSGLGYTETSCADRIGGGRCAVVDGVPRCVTDDASCTDGAQECAGSVLRTCIDGRFIEVDCGEFLDATCVEDTSTTTPLYGCVSSSWALPGG